MAKDRRTGHDCQVFTAQDRASDASRTRTGRPLTRAGGQRGHRMDARVRGGMRAQVLDHFLGGLGHHPDRATTSVPAALHDCAASTCDPRRTRWAKRSVERTTRHGAQGAPLCGLPIAGRSIVARADVVPIEGPRMSFDEPVTYLAGAPIFPGS